MFKQILLSLFGILDSLSVPYITVKLCHQKKQTLKPLFMLGVQMQNDLGEWSSNNVIGI